MKTKNLIIVFLALCMMYAGVCLADVPEPARPVFKVLPIALLLVNTLYLALKTGDRGRYLMSAALLFSAIGDISGPLMTMGIFFALSHCFYITAYSRHFCLKTVKQWVCIAILLLIVGAVTAISLPGLLRTSGPAMIAVGLTYLVVLTAMSFMAISQSRPCWILFAVGSLLFVVSDSSIIVSTYAFAIPARHLMIMSTYYAAQLLMNLK